MNNFLLFVFFEIGAYYVALTVLEFIMHTTGLELTKICLFLLRLKVCAATLSLHNFLVSKGSDYKIIQNTIPIDTHLERN